MKEIPDYQTLMLPVLKALADGNEHKLQQITENLSKEFNLTEEELSRHIPSGTQSIFYNRVGWAKTYLKKAGLLENCGKGVFKITNEGKNVLKNPPEKIDNKFLKQYENFNDFYTRTSSKEDEIVAETDYKNQTPEELIETAFCDFQKSLAEELLEKNQDCFSVIF